MKHNLKKSASILLALLFLLPSFAIFGVKAAISPLDGQKVLPVMEVTLPVVQDGEILGDEYGTEEPTLRLFPGKDFWAEDMEGNPVTENLPSYIDLYLARKGERLFVGIVTQEERHTVNEYLLDAFLGFGDSTNSHTMNSGNTTSYRMKKMTRATYLREWMDTRPYAHTAKIVAEDGTVTDSTPLYDKLYEYPLVEWGGIGEDENALPITTFEVELGLEDAVIGSGKEWTTMPDYGYFAFDLALFNGSERCGTLHFSSKMGGAGEAKSAPHILDLAGNTPIDLNERCADLASLELENAVLTPAFDPEWYEYSAELSFDLPAVVNAVAKAKDSGASVQILGDTAVGTNGTGTIRILVTAKSGYQKTYLIHVKRDYIYQDFTAADQSAFDAILEEIAKGSYTQKDAVRINLDGQIASESGVLFGMQTLWSSTGSQVPIFIRGGTVNLPEGSVSSANSITFQDVFMPIGDKNTVFYAGAGNVVFDGVDFGENGKDAKAKFFGDTATDAVFQGWSEEQKQSLSTSITFKGNTVYTPRETLLGAVGSDVTVGDAEKQTASFIVDGATVSHVGARVGKANVGVARAELRSGSAKGLYGDDGKGVLGVTDTLAGTTEILVTGGTVEKICPLNRVILDGEISLTVEEIDPLIPTVIGEIRSASLSQILGFSNLTVKGGTVTGDVTGSPSDKAVYNTVTGGTFKGDFMGVEGSARKIVNTLSDATFGGNVYGASRSSSYVRGVTNTLNGLTVTGSIYGGCGEGILYGNVKNSLNQCTVKEGFFGGNKAGTVNGNVKNTVTNGKFSNSWAIVDKAEKPDVALMPCFAGGNEAGLVKGSITNAITGGEFTKTFTGSGNCDVTGNVTNTLSGSVSIADCFFGGSSSPVISSVIGGTITNHIKAEADGAAPSINCATTGHGIAYTGGSHGVTVKDADTGVTSYFGEIKKGIVNIVEAGNLRTRVFFSSLSGKDDGIGLNRYGESVTNFVSGGVFSNDFNGGSVTAAHLGDIRTEISGGTFKGALTGGNRSTLADEVQTVILNISGGEFQNIVYGAALPFNTDSQKTNTVDCINMTISGGSFRENVYLGGKYSIKTNSATLLITGGHFDKNVVAGSASISSNVTSVTVNPTSDDIFFGGSVSGRNSNETILLKGGAKKLLIGSNSALAFTSYDGAAQTVEQTESFVADHVYLTVPSESTSSITMEGNVTVTDGQFIGKAE